MYSDSAQTTELPHNTQEGLIEYVVYPLTEEAFLRIFIHYSSVFLDGASGASPSIRSSGADALASGLSYVSSGDVRSEAIAPFSRAHRRRVGLPVSSFMYRVIVLSVTLIGPDGCISFATRCAKSSEPYSALSSKRHVRSSLSARSFTWSWAAPCTSSCMSSYFFPGL